MFWLFLYHLLKVCHASAPLMFRDLEQCRCITMSSSRKSQWTFRTVTDSAHIGQWKGDGQDMSGSASGTLVQLVCGRGFSSQTRSNTVRGSCWRCKSLQDVPERCLLFTFHWQLLAVTFIWQGPKGKLRAPTTQLISLSPSKELGLGNL